MINLEKGKLAKFGIKQGEKRKNRLIIFEGDNF